MSTSVAKKIGMALSGFFLLVFLVQHLTINALSVFSPELFNEVSHWMGTNPFIQILAQPILAFAVVFHLVMGMLLELKNRSSRPVKYAKNSPSTNSTWVSRNMIYTGLMILLFLGLHFYDFWLPELNIKYIGGDMSGMNEMMEFRYFEELQHKFQDPIRVGLYVLSFVFLALHLLHGFQSAFQSVGFRHSRYTPIISQLSNIYAVVIPLGFIIIAIFHYSVH